MGDGEFKKRILSLTPVDIALYHGTWQAWDARYVKQMQKLVDEAKWAFPLKELYGAEDICSPEGEALFEISQWFKKWFGEDERVH